MLAKSHSDRVSDVQAAKIKDFQPSGNVHAHYPAWRGNCVLFLFQLVTAFTRIGRFAVLAAAALAHLGADGVSAQTLENSAGISDAERSRYYQARDICKQVRTKPMEFDLDGRVLCFDGVFRPGLDLSMVKRLHHGGIFVVRSRGGGEFHAIILAEALRERQAVVVVYDYCLSACASFLLFASEKTFVTRDTLVAWHYPIERQMCPSWQTAKDDGPMRLEMNACAGASAEFHGDVEHRRSLQRWFFSTRLSTPLFESPPQSAVVRRLLQTRFGGGGLPYPPSLMWTWHPRYYASMIKTAVIYDAYPETQEAAEELARRHGIDLVYDP